MEHHNHDEEDLADLAIRGGQDRVEVAQQEGDRETETDGDEDPVEEGVRGPADEGDGDPDQVGVSVEGPALEEVGGFAAKVSEGEEEGDGDEEGVAVDKTSGA